MAICQGNRWATSNCSCCWRSSASDDEAYGVPIANAIAQSTGKRVILASVYNTLERLEEKGFVTFDHRPADARARRPRQTLLFDHDDRVAGSQGRQEGADGAVAGDPGPRGMNMAFTRLALWLLNRTRAQGQGSPRRRPDRRDRAAAVLAWWVCQQLIGFYGVALGVTGEEQARVTPLLVALVLGMVLLGGVSVASIGKVLEVWMSLYFFAGTMSLFGHAMSRNPASRALQFNEESDRR